MIDVAGMGFVHWIAMMLVATVLACGILSFIVGTVFLLCYLRREIRRIANR